MTDAAAKAPLEKHLPPLGAGDRGAARDVDPDALLEGFLAYVDELGIEPYPAQEEAILELFSGKNVILNTPTGSGKSLVALALHYKGLAENRVSFYTAPIKALVNEKFFSLCKSLGADNVGLPDGRRLGERLGAGGLRDGGDSREPRAPGGPAAPTWTTW